MRKTRRDQIEPVIAQRMTEAGPASRPKADIDGSSAPFAVNRVTQELGSQVHGD